MEDVPSTYLSGQDDVDNLPYPLPSIGKNEACAPIPCPGGVEIVLVGGGEANDGAYPEEGGVLTSYPHIGYREDNREGIRITHPRDSDGMNSGIMGRPDQDHHSSKYNLPAPDHLTLHQPGTHTAPWGYSASDAHEEGERESDGMTSEDQYLQSRRYEWSSGLDEEEGQSQLLMIRSDPPPINMPAFRRALHLGRAHEAWQGGNYSEEDAHVEVEEEEEEEGSVYTCIECNIYFKKKAHLLEHMFQHSQEEGEGLQAGEESHTCGECGKGFVDEESLESHRQLHQESRQKIIEEIGKLENLADEGRDARLQCPKCLFGTNSSKVFVQHAKTHVRKVAGETRGNPASFRSSSETLEGGETSEMANEAMWKAPDADATIEKGWRSDLHKPVAKGPSKITRNNMTKEDSENSMHEKLNTEGEIGKSTKALKLPEAAVKLKKRFQETLRSGGKCEEDQRQQLREQVAVVFLKNIGAKKQRPKGHQPLGKKLSAGNKGLLSRYERHLTRDDWGEAEEDVPLDALLTDPKYASQLEALGLRSEERECPYCPDRFHNGIGLANHVRGHLNRVGVSYNVRHFISAEEVKAIEQNYSFQKKRKKVANFDPSTFSLMRCEFCGAGFDTRAGLSSHARAHLRDFGITNWELTVSPIHVLARLLARSPGRPLPPFPPWQQDTDTDALSDEDDGSPLDLGRPQISKPDRGQVEKMASDQSGEKTEDSKAPSSEEVRCEFCGEFFENRKGLSSHARSHLRQMGVTEWHVNGSPIDTLREIMATGNCPRSANRIGGPDKHLSHHPPSSPSGSHSFSGLSQTMHRKPPRLPTFTASEWPTDLSPLNLSSRADPTRDIRCEFCNEFFENRKGLSSHARSHLRQMGVTEWHVNGSPIDTLREIIRKRRPGPQQQISTIKKEPRSDDEPPSPSQRLSPLGTGSQGMGRDMSVSAHGRPHNNFLSPMPAKRPLSHGPRQPDPRGFVNIEPKTCNQSKSYMHGEPRPKSYIQDDGRPKTFLQGDARPKAFLQSADGRPKTFIHEGRPKGFMTGDHRPKAFMHGEHKPKPFLQGDGRPKPYLPGEGKPKHFMHTDSKPKVYSPDGKPKAYIQTELPFKVKVKASPEKTAASLEACCELCGLFFENRKALASHARAHLRQFGVTEWCVNGSPIETLREWMKQRPQKAGAYLSYIQGGRPYTKKFKRALQSPKPGVTERESPSVTPVKVAEAEQSAGAHGVAAEKPVEVHGHKTERRHPKPAEVPPTRDETVSDHLSKAEEPRPPVRARPVPSLVPRPPQTSLVKFVGNIYTLKCRFCDVQFQGPLSIQEQWVRHLQHHILEMNFSKSSSPPHTLSSQDQQPEPAKAQ
ncbi:protein Wiz isoform X5 [Bufo gargarizans]|uniref:protein Wiz isoform X5 n=1 Tax=Bufo gargarizans TaxID=30331 RepID=UPI001CF54306|nr:protein Wiz isoform X5 [Bufo gargarizans]